MSRKSAAWRDYQERVAALFRRMGFDAVVEDKLEGARGKHEIDVLVRTKIGGVPTTWIVECKHWKTSVPKAQVLTLVQIAQDVGADRAFLLSEKGFQAGAIAAVRKTNVSLTSIEELKAIATDSIADVSIRQSLTAVKALEQDLRGLLDKQRLRAPPSPHVDETVTLLGACLEVTMAATAALASRFPIHLPTMLSSATSASTSQPMVVVEALDDALHEIARRYAVVEAALSVAANKAADDAEELLCRVRELLACSDELLEGTSDVDEEEAKLRNALGAMRAVGRQAESLREIPAAELARAVRALMRELLDGAYLWIGDPARTPETWASVKTRTEAAISGVLEAIRKSKRVANVK